jgi:HK97 family phage major capsid protein
MATASSDTLNVNLVEELARTRLERRYPHQQITTSLISDEAEKVWDEIEKLRSERADGRRPVFSLVRAVRGMAASRKTGAPILPETAEADRDYITRTLTIGSTPSSYLVPTVQAPTIISQLLLGSATRLSGATIWNLGSKVQSENVPIAVLSPTFQWMPSGQKQTSSDASLGQMAFNLKELWSFQSLPVQLFKAAVPAYESEAMLEMWMGLALADAEDLACFSTTQITNAPLNLLSAPGLLTLNCGGSLNGSNLNYSDILACLEKAAVAKIKPPYCWYMSPHGLTRVLALADAQSRPLLLPNAAPNPVAGSHFSLMGYPVYLTTNVANNMTLGSGSGQTAIILTNPKLSIHLAQDSGLQLMLSTDFNFDAAEIAIRIGARRDFGYRAAGIVALLGVN